MSKTPSITTGSRPYSLCSRCILIVFLLLTGIGANAQREPEMSNNESIIREFVTAWSRLDAVELASYFAVDGIYHNIPSRPVQGRENIQQFIAGFIAPWESTTWEIITLLSDGDTVIVERVDRTVVAGKAVDLPCTGVFELQNGEIKAWRDYFDLATYTKALTEAMATQ